MNWRTKDDYRDLFDLNKVNVDSMRPPAMHSIDKVTELFDLCELHPGSSLQLSHFQSV